MVASNHSTIADSANKKSLLFILPEAPFPPRKNGFSVRFFPLIRELSKWYLIDLAIVTVRNVTMELGELRECVNNIFIIPDMYKPSLHEKILAQLTKISPWGVPYDFYRYSSSIVVKSLLALKLDNYHALIWACENHFLDLFSKKYRGNNLVIDAVDSMTLWKSRTLKSGNLIDNLSLSKMKRWEAAVLRRAKKIFFISDADAELMRELLPSNTIQVMPNGIYFDDYHENKLHLPSPSIGYLGNMSYRPNIDAAERVFLIYKKLKQKFPDLSLYIVGRNPSPEIQRMKSEPDVIVTGTVDSIWNYVNGIDIFVLPMTLGAGQQNKLLEILYAGKPAVVSTVANSGIKAKDGLEVFVRDSEDTTIACIEQLLSAPDLQQSLGNAGKAFITREYSWGEIGHKYSDALNK